MTCSPSVFAQRVETKDLTEGTKVERTLSPSEEHVYTVELDNGMAIVGEVDQQGIDLVIDVYGPSRKLLKQLDSPNGTNGLEKIDWTSNQSGQYQFVIRSLDKNAGKGRYSLTVLHILSLSDNSRRIAQKELPTTTLFNLWKAAQTDSNAIKAFVRKHKEKHIIESIEGEEEQALITYFCIPGKNTEYVMLSGGPDFLGLRFQRLGNTPLFFTTQRAPKNARFNYGFNYFKLYQAGPNNEIEYRNVEHAYDGVVEMPNAPKQSYITDSKNVAKGNLLVTSIKSKTLKEERKITIHTPANYDSNKPHHLLIIFDGEAYGARPNRRSRIPTPTIMDNLLAEGEITPTVTVMVWSMGKRSRDLISESFGHFIAKELIPWTKSKYTIYSQANKVVLAGSSRGGFAASYIALRHSNTIGNVLSQSGSYWIKGTKDENHWIYPEDNGKLINLYKKSQRLPIKFYMDVGLYDAGASMLGMNRQFRDILEIKGYEVDYREFKGGHNYINWRGTLSDGIISLIGAKKK